MTPIEASSRSSTRRWPIPAAVSIALVLAIASALAPAPIAFATSGAAFLIALLVVLHLRSRRGSLQGFGCAISALAIACFLATLAEELVLGGTPVNGKIEAGQYFVGSHGHFSRVSKRTYHLAMVPDLGVIVLWPAMLVFAMLVDAKGAGARSAGPAAPGSGQPSDRRGS